MSATSIPVARILQLKIPIAWQEAVEVARAAENAADAASVPLLLDDCVISIRGTVHLIGSAATRLGTPITALGLLGMLLEGQSAPAELRALIAAGDSALSSFPAEQGDTDTVPYDLDYFTGSRPEFEIGQLAARAIEVAAEHDAQAAILRLRAEVVELPAVVIEPAPSLEPAARRVAVPLAVAASALLLAVFGLTVRALSVSTAGSGPGPAPRIAAAESPAAVAPAAAPTIGAGAPAAAPSPVAGAPAGRAAPVTAVAGGAAAPIKPAAPRSPQMGKPASGAAGLEMRTPPASSATPVNTQPVGNPSPAAPPDGGEPVAAVGTTGAETAASVAVYPPSSKTASPVYPASTVDEVVVHATPPRVYSQQDGDVVPPVLLRQQLPSEMPQLGAASESHIEVTVDERGQVARVRLHSSDPSLNARMFVAAAKAWQFQPAVRNGQPVPYVMTLPINP